MAGEAQIAMALQAAAPKMAALFGPEVPVWKYGPWVIPVGSYHRAVVAMPTLPAAGVNQVAVLEAAAEASGFRFLRVTKIEGMTVSIQAGRNDAVYGGYVSSDLFPKTVDAFKKAIGSASAVVDQNSVTLVEKTALDGLWLAKGEAKRILDESKKAIDEGKKLIDQGKDLKIPPIDTNVKVDVWPIVLGAVGVIVAGGVVYWLVKRRKK